MEIELVDFKVSFLAVGIVLHLFAYFLQQII